MGGERSLRRVNEDRQRGPRKTKFCGAASRPSNEAIANFSHLHATATIPGKVMLAGEYSVLRGGRALATTVDRYLTVRCNRTPGTPLTVSSRGWHGPQAVPADRPENESPLVAAAALGRCITGLAEAEIAVDSDLDPKWGLGSSSALRLGVLLAMDAVGDNPTLPEDTKSLWALARHAWQLQKKAQTFASGYDVAAQLVGGMACLTPSLDPDQWPGTLLAIEPAAAARISALLRIFVGGGGAPTLSVTRETVAWLDATDRWTAINQAGESLVAALLDYGHRGCDVGALVLATAESRRAFAEAPSYPRTLARALEAVPGGDRDWTFKTTGAGGEDAVILVGADVSAAHAVLAQLGWKPLPASLGVPGACVTRGGYPS